MTRFRQGRTMAAGLVVASLVLLSACSGSAATTAPATNAPATTAPSGAAPSVAASTKATGTVGIVGFDTTSPMDNTFATAAQAFLEKDGFTVLTQDPKGDPGQANTICSQYVTRQVVALLVVTFNKDQMAQCMSQADAAKIPVFFSGSPLQDGMAGAVDNTAPPPINDVFMKYLKDNGITDILSLDYSPGTPCRLRAAYREDALSKSGLNVKESKHEFPIPGQVVDSQNATAAWLAAHPAGSGKFAIWSCFADSSSGAVAALNQVGRTDVPIFTWDLTKAIVPAIKTGQVAATLYLDAPGIGGQDGQLIEAWLAGNTTPKGEVAASTIVTKDNIDAVLAAHPEVMK
jgi:ribose transport system substrate-binding protein